MTKTKTKTKKGKISNKISPLYHKPEKNPGDKLKKNPGVQEIFLRFETDLNFSRP